MRSMVGSSDVCSSDHPVVEAGQVEDVLRRGQQHGIEPALQHEGAHRRQPGVVFLARGPKQLSHRPAPPEAQRPAGRPEIVVHNWKRITPVNDGYTTDFSRHLGTLYKTGRG